MGRRFYLLGGRGEKPVTVYDPATNTWSEASKPPIEIHHFQSVVYENRIWVLGALTRGYPDETPVSNILIYDPGTDQWPEGPEIPANRCHMQGRSPLRSEIM